MRFLKQFAPFIHRDVIFLSRKPRRRLFVHEHGSPPRAEQVSARWEQVASSPGVEKTIRQLRRRRLFTEHPFTVSGREILAKAYVYPDLSRKLEGMFFFSDAQRNYFTLCYLQQHGVHVTTPVGLVQEYTGPFVSGATLFVEKLPARATDYKEFLSWLDRQEQAVRSKFFTRLGQELAAVHKLGVFTKDMDKNMMVEGKGEDFLFYFFDFDSVYPWRVPNRRRTTISLKKYITPYHKWPQEDLLLFYSSYFEARAKQEWMEGALAYVRNYMRANKDRYPE